jgi:sugar-specific transcriptional regulator TrmB
MADLGDLGLSEYEAQVYRTLLETGPTTAKALSEASGVPMGRIYDVLGSVETLGLVRSQSAGRPKKYAAVEPAAALDRLLADRKRELEERAAQYETVVEELKEDLDAAPARGDTFWTAALGPEETLDLLAERIDAATEGIVVAAGIPGSGFDLAEVGERMTDRLAAAADRGVDVRVLVSMALVANAPDAVYRRYAGDLTDRDTFAVRVSEEVAGSFVLLDGDEVCIEVPDPLDGEDPFATINLKDAAFVTDARDAFEGRWESAETLPDDD